MAKYDQGGGCPCGLYRVCECDLEDVRAPRPEPVRPADPQPVKEIDVTKQVTVNRIVSIREAIIQSLVDAIPKQFIQAVVLRLMLRDEITRAIVVEGIGEAANKQLTEDRLADEQNLDRKEVTWDEIGLKVIHEILDTPGGRGEVE